MAVIETLTLDEIRSLRAPLYAFGATFTAAKNSTTSIDIAIPVKFALNRVEFWVQDHHYQSSVDGFLFDKDDVLGGGSVALSQFASGRHFANETLNHLSFEVINAITITGLYIRFNYTNAETGALASAATGWVNFFGFNLTNSGI